MKYVVFLVDYADKRWDDLTEAEQGEWFGRFEALDQAVRAREDCSVIADAALTGGESATVLRVNGGESVLTDGPFAESTEAIGGFYLVEAPDLDTVVELFTILSDYVMEIRPVVEY